MLSYIINILNTIINIINNFNKVIGYVLHINIYYIFLLLCLRNISRKIIEKI